MPKAKPLTMPSLRGTFGSWVYYTCLMRMGDLAARVHFAREVHESKKLSEYIQRALQGERSRNIAGYLRDNEDRFFNSLVLATYDGSPQWYDIGNLRSSKNSEVLDEMAEGAIDTLGLLRLDGSEQIFALDGQHRLAGMKMAVKDGGDLLEELVPVILVGHGIDEAGSRRTRRLFTTLNKTAIPVNKKDIIALDEDDVMAITARRMVERDPGFKDPKVAVVASESMPANNHESLITIAALYDLLKLLFMHRDNARGDYKLRFNRPPDDELDAYHTTAKNYFAALGRAFPPMAEFLKARNPGQVVPKYRTGEGGHILFRALGLEIATRAAIAAAKRDGSTIEKAVADVISKMPVDLAQPPYAGIIWDTARSTIRPANKTLARRLVFHMLRLPVSARQQATLEGDFRAALGYERDDAKVKLPKPVI